MYTDQYTVIQAVQCGYRMLNAAAIFTHTFFDADILYSLKMRETVQCLVDIEESDYYYVVVYKDNLDTVMHDCNIY